MAERGHEGLPGGMASCATVIEENQAANTALGVGSVFASVSTGAALLFWFASAVSNRPTVVNTNPAAPVTKSASPQVELAPTPGGFVIRGAF